MNNSKFDKLVSFKRKHIGWDYEDNVLNNVISPYLSFNEKQKLFIAKLQEMIVQMIRLPKIIKQHYAYTIKKNDFDFN